MKDDAEPTVSAQSKWGKKGRKGKVAQATSGCIEEQPPCPLASKKATNINHKHEPNHAMRCTLVWAAQISSTARSGHARASCPVREKGGHTSRAA
eukprot:1159279-Pelagomonas_calceolata.AAC.27